MRCFLIFISLLALSPATEGKNMIILAYKASYKLWVIYTFSYLKQDQFILATSPLKQLYIYEYKPTDIISTAANSKQKIMKFQHGVQWYVIILSSHLIWRVPLFKSKRFYCQDYCTTSWPELPVQPPQEVDKIWTIRKTNTTLNIECNGVEVLNYQFSDSSLDDCVKQWGGDVVAIEFSSYDDTASDSYRAAAVCPGFNVDGSVQGSWNDTDPGETVTINCQKKHVLDGSSERTCNSEGEWESDAPLCRKIGKIRCEIGVVLCSNPFCERQSSHDKLGLVGISLILEFYPCKTTNH
eukprot:sb/3467492/